MGTRNHSGPNVSKYDVYASVSEYEDSGKSGLMSVVDNSW